MCIGRSKDLSPTIGIIGFGQMGQFVGRLFSGAARVVGFDPDPEVAVNANAAAIRVSLADAAGQDLVFLFPPISRFGDCCRMIRDHLRPGTVVVEGCSVMTKPVAQMMAILPPSVELIGCHPLFGPQSGEKGVAGFKVVLSPVRTQRLDDVGHLFTAHGVEVVVMSPEEHDRAMARTQALEQLIGRVLIRMGIAPERIDVPGYRKLLELRDMLASDSSDLFRSIQMDNPFASDVVAAFEEALAATLCDVRGREGGR